MGTVRDSSILFESGISRVSLPFRLSCERELVGLFDEIADQRPGAVRCHPPLMNTIWMGYDRLRQ